MKCDMYKVNSWERNHSKFYNRRRRLEPCSANLTPRPISGHCHLV